MATKKSAPSPDADKPAKKAAKKASSSTKPKVAPSAEAHPSPVPAEPRPRATHDQVARRAYEIWLARGGHAFENWVEAERQLNEE